MSNPDQIGKSIYQAPDPSIQQDDTFLEGFSGVKTEPPVNAPVPPKQTSP